MEIEDSYFKSEPDERFLADSKKYSSVKENSILDIHPIRMHLHQHSNSIQTERTRMMSIAGETPL